MPHRKPTNNEDARKKQRNEGKIKIRESLKKMIDIEFFLPGQATMKKPKCCDSQGRFSSGGTVRLFFFTPASTSSTSGPQNTLVPQAAPALPAPQNTLTPRSLKHLPCTTT
jgi:hypothetical protein